MKILSQIFGSYSLKDLQKSVISWIVIFSVFITLSIWYAALSSGLWTSDKSSGGSVISANSWNKIIDSVLELDSRTSLVTNSGGKVWINNPNPSATLDVNGSTKIWWVKIARITVCGWASDGGMAATNGNYFTYWWKNADCSNNLPSGNCISFQSKGVHCGQDEDWETLNPGETNYQNTSFVNGGMTWWTASACTAVRLKAVYFCDQ